MKIRKFNESLSEYEENFSLNVKTVGELKEMIKDLPDDYWVLGYNGGNGDLYRIGGWISEDDDGKSLVIDVDN